MFFSRKNNDSQTSLRTSIHNSWKHRYHISSLELADSAETNRLHVLFVTPFLFAFGLGDLILVSVLHLNNFREYLSSFIYFGVFTVTSLFAFIFAHRTKNISREKAYFYKSIPFYMLLWTGFSAAIYNFYILGQPFNGVLTYCLTGFLAMIAFSFSPLPFILTLAAGLSALVSGVYKNFGLSGLMDTILIAVCMGGLSLFKRRIEKKYIMLLKKQKKNLEAKTFGNFTLLYDNKVIKFSRTRSTEVLAYLIFKNGSSVKTKELISILWGDHANSARYGSSLRNLIVDIKHVLSELEIQNFFVAEYNNFRINPDAVQCDYYDFLQGDEKVAKTFSGEFMSQYSWAEDTAGFIERKNLSNSGL